MRLTSAAVAAVAATALVAGTAALTATPSSAATARTTKTALVASARPVATTPVKLTATVTPKPTGGVVTFKSGGVVLKKCGAIAVKAGKAVCSTRFATSGTKHLSATYGGKAPYKKSVRTATITVARAAGTVVGGVGSCTTAKGALVGVDFAHWSGPIVRGCDAALTANTTGADLLAAGGFKTTGVSRFPSFVCRIGHALFNGGTQYPTSADDACVVTPPASAYWAFWTAKKGVNTWTYATTSASGDRPVAGEVEAWTFGSTSIDGTSGKPTFTPNQLRAGLPAATASARAAAAPRAAAGQASVSRTAAYVVGQLVDGTHYEQFGSPDLGLTLDGALGLAAAGTNDTALSKIAAYASEHAGDYTLLGTPDEQYADGGSIGKVALLAEVTGYDPNAFGGLDLIKALADRVCTKKVDTLATQCAAAGNYENASSVFKQSLGVLAQLRAGAPATAPVAFLEGLQHDSGAFPSLIPGTDSDVDSTAMAAMALSLVDTDAARSAVTKAVAWIAGQQGSDGSFTGTAGKSVNTAALALQGLTLGGAARRTEIDKAQAFLAGVQNKDGGFPVSADADNTDSDLRASTQALGGIVATPLSTLSDDVHTPALALDRSGAVEWLIGKLVDGTHLEYDGGYGPNYGGTADLAVALAADGTHDAVLNTVLKYVIAHVADYADPAGTGQYPGPYGGAVGKLAVLAESTGQDPTHFGGFDLLTTLTDHVCTSADNTGACTAAGDFYQAYSSVSQAYGVLALARAGRTVPAAALARLEQLQCTDGGFSSTLIAPGDKCSSDVDTTGYAVQALALVPSAADVLHRAVGYLRGAQETDGGWTGAAGENTNSTALAVQGLLAAPAAADQPAPSTSTATAAAAPRASASDPAVKRALAFLATLQNRDGGFGISAATPASDAIATTQAIPAIDFATLTRLVHVVVLAAPTTPPSSPSSAPTSGGGSTSTSAGSGPTSGTTTAPASGVTSTVSISGGGGALANTGAPTQNLLGYALVLLVLGAVLTALGRRRRLVTARHRGRHTW